MNNNILIIHWERLKLCLIRLMGIMVLAVGLSLTATAMATGALMVDDHFDNGILDPAWTVTLQNVSSWNYIETGSDLLVHDIVPINSNTEWSTVTLSRQFSPVTDFFVDFDFAWDSGGLKTAMQYVNIGLYDETGRKLTSVWYFDAWSDKAGEQLVYLWDERGIRSDYRSGPGSWPADGRANVDIIRRANSQM